MIRFRLPDDLARELCARLDAPLPSTWGDVATLYRQWCARIPFDTIAKSIALDEGTVPPGADAVEVVERWLATGVGSACWGHCTAFAGVLGAVGIESRIAVDRAVRQDGVVDFHSFVIAAHEGRDWAFDHIHAVDDPLPFEVGVEGSHGPYTAGFRLEDGRMCHWYTNPERPDADERYLVLSTDLDLDDVRAFCAISVQHSGVRVGRLYTRRFPADGFVHGLPVEDGSALEVRRWSGERRTDSRHADPADALAALGYPPETRSWAERAKVFTVDAGVVHWSTGVS